jgi:hypothetical protein
MLLRCSYQVQGVFMPRFVPLNKSTHAEAGIAGADYQFALEQAVVSVVVEELPQVIPMMVVAFVPAANRDGYELVALQSLEQGKNVYVHTNGRWIGGYKPSWYRAHPFALRPTADNGNQRVLCVDEEAEAFLEQVGEYGKRIFDEAGEPTAVTRNLLSFLEHRDKAVQVTQEMVKKLAELELIVPWKLSVNRGADLGNQDVTGLYHIDEARLRQLSPDDASALLKSGAMSVAFSQLISEHRLQGLTRLYDLRRQAEALNKPADGFDVESLFADDDEDNLSF